MAKSAFEQSPGNNSTSGSVIGVAYTYSSTPLALSAGAYGAWTDTGITISITPTQLTSKIFIDGMYTLSTGDYAMYFRLVRGSTPISVGTVGTKINYGSGSTGAFYSNGTYRSAVGNGSTFPIQALDSPNTTNAITYKLQYCVNGGGFALNRLNSSLGGPYMSGTTQLVAFEILPL